MENKKPSDCHHQHCFPAPDCEGCEWVVKSLDGYILVKNLKSGTNVWKKRNEAGGWCYYGESCGILAQLWDDCIGTIEELKAVMHDVHSCSGCQMKKQSGLDALRRCPSCERLPVFQDLYIPEEDDNAKPQHNDD